MASKSPLLWRSLSALLILLTSCTTAPAESDATAKPPITEEPTSVPTFLPTIDVSQMEPTITSFIGTPPTSTLPKFPMDGYVMTFVKEGYLYFQDEENAPVQLAPVDEEAKQSYISDDNQKVVFHGADGNVYSINSDGSQKLVIVSKEWKDSLQAETSIFIEGFVPDSHRLFFRTELCESQEWWTPCSTSLFLADTDTGNFKKLADLGLASQYPPGRNIRISPNGKMIAIGDMEHLDILDMDGNIIRQNILTYKPSTPSRSLFPSLFWLPDSSGLTIAVPDSKDRDGYLAYSLWRYTIGNKSIVQISFDPAPMYDDSTFDVSPDGNWVVYGNLYVVFLGNLVNEQVKIIEEEQQSSFSWGPDSRYFAFGTGLWSITSIDNPSVVIETPSLKEWVDSTHYLNYYIEDNEAKVAIAEISGDTRRIYDLEGGEDSQDSVFIKPK